MNKQELLALALEYANKGVPVFFLDLNTKAPVESGLGGFKGATSDRAELVERLDRLHSLSTVGVGLHPGAAGYVVLDVDDKNGKEGTNNLRRLMLEVGGELPETAVALTPSGGKHIWYRKDAFVGNGDLCDGVNVRADSGYVVAPGQTRSDGKGWSWEPGRELDKVTDWPRWVSDVLSGLGKQTGSDHWQELDWSKVAEEDREMTELLLEVGAGKNPSIQNGSVYLVAPHKPNGVGISIGYIGPGIAKIWDDAIKLPDGRELPHEEVFNIFEFQHWLETGQHPNATKVKQQGPVLAQVMRKKSLRDSLMTLDEIEQVEPPAYLIQDYLVEGGLAMMYADPGVGKSFLAIDWMMHLAAGIDWQGHKVSKAVPVFYIAAEGQGKFGLRTKAWRLMHTGLELKEVNILPIAVNLATSDVDELLELLEELRPGLVIVDTLARTSAGADGNSDKDMGIVVANATAIQQRAGSAVLILHHTGHIEKNRARGSSSLPGAMDSMFQLDGKIMEKLTLTVTKQKDDEPTEPLKFRMRKVEVDEKVTSLVLVSPEDELEDVEDEGPTVDPKLLKVVEVLWRKQLSTEHGLTATEWRDAVHHDIAMNKNVFFDYKKMAVEQGYVRQIGDKRTSPFAALKNPFEEGKIQVTVSEREAQA